MVPGITIVSAGDRQIDLLVVATAVPGADVAPPTGAIEGRVFSAASNNYLERVRHALVQDWEDLIAGDDEVVRQSRVFVPRFGNSRAAERVQVHFAEGAVVRTVPGFVQPKLSE